LPSSVGVEIGQLSFVMLMLLMIAVIKRIRFQFPNWTYRVPAYMIGALAMYWVIERVLAI